MYDAEILEVRPGTVEEDPEFIVDAYVRILINDMEIWCFVPHWRTYFPCGEEQTQHTYGVGKTLINNLAGKRLSVRLLFLALKTESSPEKSRMLVPMEGRKKPCDYVVFGEIITKDKSPRLPDKYERISLDCGVALNNLSIEAGKYEIGDYIKAEGRLDLHFINI